MRQALVLIRVAGVICADWTTYQNRLSSSNCAASDELLGKKTKEKEMARFIEVESPNGESTFFVNLDVVQYLEHIKKTPGTVLIHFDKGHALTAKTVQVNVD